MNKNIWLIAKREYLTRVKSKTFLLTTFLTPLGIILFFAVVAFIFSQGSDDIKKIAIQDSSDLLRNELKLRDNFDYSFSTLSIEQLKEQYLNGDIDGFLTLNALEDPTSKQYAFSYYSDDRLALDEIESIKDAVEKRIREYKVSALDLDEEKIALLKTEVTLEQNNIKDTAKKVSTTGTIVGSVLGGVIAYAMFFIILLYGSQVMRSVMEEKINRIVEVLISSVKPFELMMGKILGVGSVGLTQILIWLILFVVISIVAQPFLGSMMNPGDIAQIPNAEGVIQAAEQVNKNKFVEVLGEVMNMNWWTIIPLLLFYFFMGYFAYAALFAAIGSAVGEDINEAQTLTLPVMMPLMLAIYIGIAAINAPNSTIATWGSIIPFTSSIVMPVRLPMDPPTWQILLSVVLLVVTVFLLVWLAARIYRVGILMYGKKASFKELAKWMMYKG